MNDRIVDVLIWTLVIICVLIAVYVLFLRGG